VLDDAHRLPIAAKPASAEDLGRVHPSEYVTALSHALAHGWGHLDPDTFFSPGSAEAAWLAAGGVAEMVRTLMRGDAQQGVALLRPPGHHAEPERSMGFCMLNNVAIAATAALDAGAERVAIVDWDVHHGNGTQATFFDDPRVLFVSLHQYPFYPGTGASDEIGRGEAAGSTVNLALPAGCGPEAYGDAFRRVVMPALGHFGADLLLVSAGFDAHARDPLANMQLDDATYQAMATSLLAHVQAQGHGRIGFVLEGGYDLKALEASVSAVARALLGERTALPEDTPSAAQRAAIDATLHALAPHVPLGDARNEATD
jgi:acetoin utilization deacetylase AcuC-like enzyme